MPPVAGWSERELATLAELAETFVRGGAVRRASLAADALATAADPDQVAQLRLVLRLIESPVANLLLARRRKAFRDLSPPERERYLLGWAQSRLPLRRSAFHGLRKLLTFLAYADPGGDTPNPLHATIGYRPDRPPVTSDLTPIRPHALPPPRDGAVELDTDVVVVGSGAGGAIVAADLSAAGRSVVVLEAGPLVDEAAMPTDELDAFDRLYLNHGLTATWDGSVTFLAGSGVGGGTTVNWMTCIDSPPDVRARWARDHGVDGWDAPGAERDVLAIEDELGVAPAQLVPPKDDVIVRGARELGWEVETIRRNGGPCTDCGSCGFGCRRGTKRSGLRLHLAAAARAGARIVPDAHVERVLLRGGKAIGVDATIADGVRLTVRAQQVVVAAGALRTPAVLERSGLAHPALGRHLRVHPVSVVAGWYDEPVDMWRGTLQGARCAQFLWPEAGRNFYLIESAPGHPGLMALALPWEGTDAHADALARSRRLAPLIAVTEDGGEGQVSLTRAGHVRIDYRLDRTGVATLRHGLLSMARLARAAGAREIVAVGMPPAWFGRGGNVAGQSDRAFVVYEDRLRAFDFAPNRGTVFSAHQMGTARMGRDPETSVCDPSGRVRDGARGALVRGLYVADGSLFPTGIGVNPMITVMALARRVGRTVLAEA